MGEANIHKEFKFYMKYIFTRKSKLFDTITLAILVKINTDTFLRPNKENKKKNAAKTINGFRIDNEITYIGLHTIGNKITIKNIKEEDNEWTQHRKQSTMAYRINKKEKALATEIPNLTKGVIRNIKK